MPCACGNNEAPYRCGWKLRKPFMIWATDLRVGDMLEVPSKVAFELVENIRRAIGSESYYVRTAITGDKFVPMRAPLMVMRNGRCEAPCCDQCAREVAEGVRYCRAHWDAGERQGAVDQLVEVEA